MPGVPGKACDKCRKQKKKCDLVQPSCSRCTKLNMPCVGAGQQRYMFKNRIGTQSQLIAPRWPSKDANYTFKNTILPCLSDKSNVTATRLVAALETSDIRYSLDCYGDFLKHIPQRLGYNDALDTSVAALVSVYQYHLTGQGLSQGLADYGEALKTVRLCLAEITTDVTAETLCAIYLLMICEGWTGPPHDSTGSHGEILVHLLGARQDTSLRDSFELSVFDTLSVPLMLEAMTNPAVTLGPWFTEPSPADDPTTTETTESPRKTGLHILTIERWRLARLADLFWSPDVYESELKSTYQTIRADFHRLQSYLSDRDDQLAACASEQTRAARTKATHRVQVVFAFLIVAMVALNSLIRAVDPFDEELIMDAEEAAGALVGMAERCLAYRPLGASFIPPSLAGVWATTDDSSSRHADLERLMDKYQPDMPYTDWRDEALWMRSLHEPLRKIITRTADGMPEGLGTSSAHWKAAFGLCGSSLYL